MKYFLIILIVLTFIYGYKQINYEPITEKLERAAELRLERERVAANKREFDNRVQGVKKFLVHYNSPMADSAESFVSCAERHRINYKLLVAISGKESTFGRYQRGFNSFGWDIHRGRTFNSFSDAICTVAEGLSKSYDTSSIRKIAYRYAPDFENNTEKWIKDVEYFMSQL